MKLRPSDNTNCYLFLHKIYFIENYKSLIGKHTFDSNAIAFQIIIPNKSKEIKIKSSDNSTKEFSEDEKESVFKSAAYNEFKLKIDDF